MIHGVLFDTETLGYQGWRKDASLLDLCLNDVKRGLRELLTYLRKNRYRQHLRHPHRRILRLAISVCRVLIRILLLQYSVPKWNIPSLNQI